MNQERKNLLMKILQTVIGLLFIFIVADFKCEYTLAITNNTLEYHETNFDTNNWFHVLQNVEIDTIDKEMRLIEATTITYEDFNTYIESDIPNHLSHTQYKSSFTNLDRTDDGVFLYKDKTNQLQTFTYYFDVYIDAIGSNSVTYRACLITISDYLDDEVGIRTGNHNAFGMLLSGTTSTTIYYLCPFEITNSALYLGSQLQLNVDTEYYGKIIKSGTALTLEIYSDSGYTTQIGTDMDLTLHSNWNLKYMMCPTSQGRSTSVTTTGYVENLRTIITGYAIEGYAYTKNLLENETNIAFSSLVNSSIGTGCNLKVYFSDDNVTWVERLYLITTGIDYTKLENLNYTSLYAKFEFTSNGINNIEVLNFFYTNIFSPFIITNNPNYLWVLVVIFLFIMSYYVLKVNSK